MVSYTPPRACSKMRMKSGMPVGMGSSGGVNANRLGLSRVVFVFVISFALDRVMRHDHIHSIDTTRRTEQAGEIRSKAYDVTSCHFARCLHCLAVYPSGAASGVQRVQLADLRNGKRHITCSSGKVDAVVSNVSDNQDGLKVCNPLFWGLVTGRFGRKNLLLMTQLLSTVVCDGLDTVMWCTDLLIDLIITQ